MAKPTKLQKEVIEVIREELGFMKACNDINSPSVYSEIDTVIEGMKHGSKDPLLDDKYADRLSDLLYEFTTLIRDIER
jgi:hypothetical protein